MPKNGNEEGHNSPEASGGYWINDVVTASNRPSSIALSQSADDTNPWSFGETLLSVKGHSDTGMLEGAEVVDITDEGLEWKGNYKCRSRHNNKQRCIQDWLGCSTRVTEDSESMDVRGEKSPHKCLGAERRSVCSSLLCPESKECSHSSEVGQSDCSSIYPKNGGHQECSDATNNTGNLAVLSRPGIFLTAEYLPGSLNTEADWQSRNFQDSSDWRLKVSVFKDLERLLGPFDLDLFASRHNAQLPKYVSWRQDPFSVEVDAFQRNWKEEGLYMFPPFAMISRCLQKISRTEQQ